MVVKMTGRSALGKGGGWVYRIMVERVAVGWTGGRGELSEEGGKTDKRRHDPSGALQTILTFADAVISSDGER